MEDIVLNRLSLTSLNEAIHKALENKKDIIIRPLVGLVPDLNTGLGAADLIRLYRDQISFKFDLVGQITHLDLVVALAIQKENREMSEHSSFYFQKIPSVMYGSVAEYKLADVMIKRLNAKVIEAIVEGLPAVDSDEVESWIKDGHMVGRDEALSLDFLGV